MQLLQYSGLLEMQAHRLYHDALHLQNAALCGTAMTHFLDMMENFFRVEEDEEEAKMEDTTSFATFIKQNKEECTKELQSKALSIIKGSIEHEEIGDGEESESVASASSQASKPHPLSQMSKHKEKYPTKCKLSEAQLFYPTSLESLHETGVDGKYIRTGENLPGYKGLYCCLFGNCDYGTQVHGNTLSHIRRVHLGAAFGCRFCPELAWWQARSWSNYMDSIHSQESKYETLHLPSGPIEAVKVEPEIFIAKEHFMIPVLKSKTVESDEPSTKCIKKEISGFMSYQEFEEASKEGDIALLAEGKNSLQSRPQVAMIRYRTKPSGGQMAEFVSRIVLSSSMEKPTKTPETKGEDLTDDPYYIPDSQEDEFDDEDLLCD